MMADMVSVLAQMMDRHEWHGGGHWWWWLIGLGVLTVIVVLAVWVIVRIAQPASAHGVDAGVPLALPRGSAEEVLADRLARGEIDVDEYRERLAALRQP
jgi:putative membrane protein